MLYAYTFTTKTNNVNQYILFIVTFIFHFLFISFFHWYVKNIKPILLCFLCILTCSSCTCQCRIFRSRCFEGSPLRSAICSKIDSECSPSFSAFLPFVLKLLAFCQFCLPSSCSLYGFPLFHHSSSLPRQSEFCWRVGLPIEWVFSFLLRVESVLTCNFQLFVKWEFLSFPFLFVVIAFPFQATLWDFIIFLFFCGVRAPKLSLQRPLIAFLVTGCAFPQSFLSCIRPPFSKLFFLLLLTFHLRVSFSAPALSHIVPCPILFFQGSFLCLPTVFSELLVFLPNIELIFCRFLTNYKRLSLSESLALTFQLDFWENLFDFCNFPLFCSSTMSSFPLP